MKNVREMSLSELESISAMDLINLSTEDAVYLADKIRMICQMLRYYRGGQIN